MINWYQRLQVYLPSLIWMAIIYYFSSLPTTGVISSVPIVRFLFFKSLHLSEYAILAIFLFIALKKFSNTIIYSYLYACTDEIHQIFVTGRNSRFTDTLLDLLGIIFGILFIQLLKKIKIVYTKL